MPTYGYECLGCAKAFEVTQRISDDPLTTCEDCGAALKKKIFPVGIVFKGSGFYVNDYAKKTAAKDEAKPVAAEPAASTDTPAPAAAASTESSGAKPVESKPARSAPAAPAAKPAVSTTTA